MKIIFDRCAFHGEDFDLLKDSPLLHLTQEGKLLIFHTTVFAEETLRMVRLENRKDELRRQWPFLVYCPRLINVSVNSMPGGTIPKSSRTLRPTCDSTLTSTTTHSAIRIRP
jgi:hypothetical protein